MNFDKINSIHFIGIGGISMSGLAMLMLNKGKHVSGSDAKKTKTTENLLSAGADIYYEHNANNVKNVDLVVYSSAVSDDNPEISSATANNIPILSRGVFLGLLMKDFEYSINISGTHGKTSTTGFITSIFEESKENATIMIGGMLDKINGNIKIGDSKFFITEACEYKDNFLNFFPTHSIILNIEEDHLDYFKDIAHIISSFEKFAKKTLIEGFLFINNDDKNINKMNLPSTERIISFGINSASKYQALNISFNKLDYPSFDVFIREKLVHFELQVSGYHNLYNALAAIALAAECDIPSSIIVKGVKLYTGTNRRFDRKGYCNNALIVDDYAHHPSAIKTTLDSVNRMDKNKTIVVFQPHTYTRTYSLLNDFAESFTGVDLLIVTDIYAAREIDTGVVHSKDLCDKILKFNPNINLKYISNFEEIVSYLKEVIEPNDIVITMGAGTVTEISDLLIK